MSLSYTSRVLEIEAIIDYIFSKKRLAVEAAQMAAPEVAFVEDNAFKALHNNKRLAILGEAVLARELCSAWFRIRGSYGEALSPAQWTQLRNDVISNDALARRGYNAGIDKVIITAHSTPIVSPKMVAATLGAIIGAVHEDGGDTAVHNVMQHLGFFDHILLTILSCLLRDITLEVSSSLPEKQQDGSLGLFLRRNFIWDLNVAMKFLMHRPPVAL